MTDETSTHTHRQMQQRIDLLTERIRLLEEQNHRLVSLLHEHGIEVREHTGVSLELPPPITEPLTEEAWTRLLDSMGDPERHIAREQLEDADRVYYGVCTASRADVGHWLGKGVVWALALEHDLFLFAAGKRPVIERIAYGQVYRSMYNHVTGELVLAPSHNLAVERLALPPAAGYQLLAQIYRDNDSNEETE